jgi:hypothetical protein
MDLLVLTVYLGFMAIAPFHLLAQKAMVALFVFSISA